MFDGDRGVACDQERRTSVGIPDSDRQHCCGPERCCRRLGRCGRWRMASLVLCGTARVGARLIVAVLMVSALAARSPLSGGAFPPETRHRSGERANHEREQKGCHSLHSSMMCRIAGVVNSMGRGKRVQWSTRSNAFTLTRVGAPPALQHEHVVGTFVGVRVRHSREVHVAPHRTERVPLVRDHPGP